MRARAHTHTHTPRFQKGDSLCLAWSERVTSTFSWFFPYPTPPPPYSHLLFLNLSDGSRKNKPATTPVVERREMLSGQIALLEPLPQVNCNGGGEASWSREGWAYPGGHPSTTPTLRLGFDCPLLPPKKARWGWEGAGLGEGTHRPHLDPADSA